MPRQSPFFFHRLLLTAGMEKRLITAEALRAFARQNWMTAAWPETDITPQTIARLFALPPHRSGLEIHPSLFFSVNFHGLDKHGEIFAHFQEKGVPVAVWCVDNPWNLLAGLRSDFWKKIRLFVTDSSFIPGLRAQGAEHVTHLPLGTEAALFQPLPQKPATAQAANLRPVVFTGRSRFPDKDRFFVGQTVDLALRQSAEECLAAGQRPDFFWWLKRLEQQSEVPLWPGSGQLRKAGLGAEEMSLFWRLSCLRAALPEGLTLFGDEGWHEHFSPDMTDAPDVRPPVDYYGPLARIYQAAEFSLNMTSFLLPHGLTQRHFDVWAAGGFCLTDATPGLDIFPPELTAPVTFARPEAIPEHIRHFRAHATEKANLARQWHEHILAHHTYDHRVATLLDAIFC